MQIETDWYLAENATINGDTSEGGDTSTWINIYLLLHFLEEHICPIAQSIHFVETKGIKHIFQSHSGSSYS